MAPVTIARLPGRAVVGSAMTLERRAPPAGAEGLRGAAGGAGAGAAGQAAGVDAAQCAGIPRPPHAAVPRPGRPRGAPAGLRMEGAPAPRTLPSAALSQVDALAGAPLCAERIHWGDV